MNFVKSIGAFPKSTNVISFTTVRAEYVEWNKELFRTITRKPVRCLWFSSQFYFIEDLYFLGGGGRASFGNKRCVESNEMRLICVRSENTIYTSGLVRRAQRTEFWLARENAMQRVWLGRARAAQHALRAVHIFLPAFPCDFSRASFPGGDKGRHRTPFAARKSEPNATLCHVSRNFIFCTSRSTNIWHGWLMDNKWFFSVYFRLFIWISRAKSSNTVCHDSVLSRGKEMAPFYFGEARFRLAALNVFVKGDRYACGTCALRGVWPITAFQLLSSKTTPELPTEVLPRWKKGAVSFPFW